MAGRRVSGSETNVLLRNEGDSVENYEALLSSNSSRAGFSGSKLMLNFEEIYGGSAINQQYFIPREIEDAIDGDINDSLHQPGKKRRLSITQVQFLEKSFKAENKLEPKRKVQLAKEIGLQPRQVAIWFQNRRARWKTKQLEKDYNALKSSYNALKVSYENMLKEKEELKGEVTHLTDILQETYINMAEEKSAECKCFTDLKPIESGTVKQEDQSSTISAVSESDSLHSTSRARTDSSNAYEAAHSGTSYIDHNEKVKEYHEFFKLEDHSGSFDFPVEDHPFWLWS